MLLAGVNVTIDTSMETASVVPGLYTALLAINGTSVVIANSRFEGLRVPQDTLLLLTNSTVSMHNTSFIDNHAAVLGAYKAQTMEQMGVQNSTFISNAGMLPRNVLGLLLAYVPISENVLSWHFLGAASVSQLSHAKPD